MSAQAVAALFWQVGEMQLMGEKAAAEEHYETESFYDDACCAVASIAHRMWDALLIQHTHEGRPWSRDEDVRKALDDAHRAGFIDAWALRDATLKAKGAGL
jgi:hypothetical protein